MEEPIVAFELRPRPCQHEAAGRPHLSMHQLRECVRYNGSPGFESVPVPLSEES